MRLDLYSLRLFIAVVEHGTIAAAADQHAIATSALSKRISELERAVGSPLLIRKARGVEATAAGLALTRGARVLIHNADNLEAELADFETGATGHVRIAANLSSIIQFLPEDLKRFSLAHPKVQISVEDRVSAQVTREVLDNSADIGIYFFSGDEPELEVFPYCKDQLVLVTPDAHPLAGRTSLAFDETLAFDQVTMRRDSSSNNLLLQAAIAARRHIRMRFQVTSFDAMIAMIKAGLGIGIVPLGAIANYTRDGLAVIDLEDDWSRRQLKLCVRSTEALPAGGRLLLEHLKAATR